MQKMCSACNEIKEHKSWKATTCNDCLASGFKWCTECKEVKPTSLFNRRGKTLNSCCKECQTKRSTASYIRTGYMQRDDVKNRRKVAKQKYYNTPHGHELVNSLVSERQRKLYNTDETYRQNKIAQCHSRRAITGSYTAKDVEVIKEFFEYSCAYCGAQENLTVDHIVALAAGGTNDVNNIIPSCLSCNCSKGSRNMHSWYTKQAFFSEERYEKILYYIEEVMK